MLFLFFPFVFSSNMFEFYVVHFSVGVVRSFWPVIAFRNRNSITLLGIFYQTLQLIFNSWSYTLNNIKLFNATTSFKLGSSGIFEVKGSSSSWWLWSLRRHSKWGLTLLPYQLYILHLDRFAGVFEGLLGKTSGGSSGGLACGWTIHDTCEHLLHGEH